MTGPILTTAEVPVRFAVGTEPGDRPRLTEALARLLIARRRARLAADAQPQADAQPAAQPQGDAADAARGPRP